MTGLALLGYAAGIGLAALCLFLSATFLRAGIIHLFTGRADIGGDAP